MLIDTHAHLNFSSFKKDLDEVIKRTLAENIRVINVGSKYETSRKAVEIAEKYEEGIYAAVGLHPIHATPDFIKKRIEPEEGGFLASGEDFSKEKYLELAKSKKVVAIGEIGLDYYYRPKTKKKIEEFKNKQKEVFLKQLGLAEELDLPVIIHCRMAHQDVADILKFQISSTKSQKNPNFQNSKLRGVVHCFTGILAEAQEYIKMGFYIGFNGIIFKLDLDEVIKQIPLEKILIETDCPYLTPPQEEDKRNEPIFVKYVVEKIAGLKNLNYEKIAEVTTQNARNLFRI